MRFLLALLALAPLTLVSCQTSDLSQRKLAAKSAPATCAKEANNSRKDCEDLPGCYWDPAAQQCTAQ